MLTKGSMIRIRQNGTRKSVEELMISDLVFDPWANKYVEVVDILSRTIEFGQSPETAHHPLYPVELKPGSVATTKSDQTLLGSPAQAIIYVSPPVNPDGPPTLRKSLAATLTDRPKSCDKGLQVKNITYYAVFTEHEQTLDVSGVLLPTYSQSVYELS